MRRVALATRIPSAWPSSCLPAGGATQPLQVLHLELGDVEPDTAVDAGHGADGDGYFLAAPQVPLLEQHVGYVVVAGVDDEPLDLADVAIGSMHALAAARRHLACGDGGVGGGLRDAADGVTRH